jgi:hypothetical protein
MKNLKLAAIVLLFMGSFLTTTSCESEDNTADLYELNTQDDAPAYAGGDPSDEDEDTGGN